MKNIVVSVIIPIYNVRGFIDKGIKQILNQTYQEYEIILIDDGSTDGSLEECIKWEQNEVRITVLHQDNSGAGSARNLGIENAKGEYIYFYDIDDEIHPKLLEYNVRCMKQYGVDIIVFGYRSIDVVYNLESRVTFTETYINSNAQLKDIFVSEFIKKVNGFPWNKFYRKSFLDKYNLRFENQRIQQDEVFNLLCYRYISKMFISPEILYDYYVYSKGNTRSSFIRDRFDIYKSVRKHFEELKSYWNLKDNVLDNYLSKRFYDGVITCLTFNLFHPNNSFSRQDAREEINRIMSDPLTVEAFEYADHAGLGLEQSLYRRACRKQSIIQLKILTSLFYIVRKCYHKIRNTICYEPL